MESITDEPDLKNQKSSKVVMKLAPLSDDMLSHELILLSVKFYALTCLGLDF